MPNSSFSARNRARVSIEQWLTFIIVSCLSTFGFYDLWLDSFNHAPTIHIILEGAFSTAGLGMTIWLVRKIWSTQRQLRIATQTADELASTAQLWEQEAKRYTAGVSAAIELEFKRWKLSPAECEVGLLLLKGLSLKEIAETRAVTERTIRQQTVSIYEKAGVAGRAELSAFFLEDLLAPASIRLSDLDKEASQNKLAPY